MAAATATTTAEQRERWERWERRALELAEARHTIGTTHMLAAESFRKVYGVCSSSGLGEYVVLLTPFDSRVICNCLAGQHGRPCCHTGAVLKAEAQRLERIETADHDRWTLIEAGQW